jgi:hypothetical protein
VRHLPEAEGTEQSFLPNISGGEFGHFEFSCATEEPNPLNYYLMLADIALASAREEQRRIKEKIRPTWSGTGGSLATNTEGDAAMQWLAWTLGLTSVLLVAFSIGRLFVQQPTEKEERHRSRAANVKRRRLFPNRWIL